MFECTAFCGRIYLGYIRPSASVLAKIFYQINSIRSNLFVSDFILQ